MQSDYKKLLNSIKNLSEKNKKALIDEIMEMMSQTDSSTKELTDTCSSMVKEHIGEKPDCPHCHTKSQMGAIIKKGIQNGVQYYYCKVCGRKFTPTTNTTFARTRKKADVWRKFIYLTITGETLLNCSIECNIAYQTAFTWRHKVLNAFKKQQESTTMIGRVEVDEMLIPLNFKGNHLQGDFKEKRRLNEGRYNDMPRSSYKRGSDNKPRSSKERACVFCMVENGTKAFYGTVPGVGFMNNTMLDHTLKKHVDKNKAIVLADQYKTTHNYLKNNEYQHMILAANTSCNPNEHKPEIRDGHHLQHVNAMHHHINRFLIKYCGVSSKYLDNYISFYVWLKTINDKSRKKTITEMSITRASVSDCYISRKALEAYPAIPKCA